MGVAEITTPYREGFNAGYMQLRQLDVKQATADLWEALGINNRNTFSLYRRSR